MHTSELTEAIGRWHEAVNHADAAPTGSALGTGFRSAADTAPSATAAPLSRYSAASPHQHAAANVQAAALRARPQDLDASFGHDFTV